MKKKFTGLFLVLCSCAAPLVGRAQANHVNILPYGDSVTSFGSAPESSYRYWLYKDLTNAGFNNFNLVGTKAGTEDGAPENPLPPDQQGFSGGAGETSASPLDSSDSADYAPNVASQTQPDIVLLDFGSNDISPAGIPLTETQANLEQIIQDIAAVNPNVIILVAKPTSFAPDPTATPQGQRLEKHEESKLTGTVAKAAKTEKKAGVRVITVNLFGGFNVKKDTKDGAHPNVIGEQKIAKKYFSELKKILKKM
jgi:lysophospholipase L1-like esterase